MPQMATTEASLERGRICRVVGPLVEARGMASVQMYEVVEVGPERLVGEVIKVVGDLATVQVYEYTGGIRPGMEAARTGRPLSLMLGPGLLGSIYDGIQRPLVALHEQTGPFIGRGAKASPLPEEKAWDFEPLVKEGEEVAPGQFWGRVKETVSVEHRLMVPPEVKGRVARIEPAGPRKVGETLCVIKVEDVSGEGPRGLPLTMVQSWPSREARPFRRRLPIRQPLTTGQRVLDTLFPLARGGAAAVPGDFGTGKTIVQQQLAKWSDADIVVYVGCGERGNEMTDVLRQFPQLQDPRTGRSLMDRTVLVANTSNMPVAAREVSIYTGITIAEYYRDMGYDVAVMADSTSRWAEALREISSRLEEMPAEEGYPAYLSARLAQFYERAGQVETLSGGKGSVTVVGAVSPPAGDFSEPVTQHTTRFTRCFWALDRELAYARHFPSVSWVRSYSEYIGEVAAWWEEQIEPEWSELRAELMNILHEEERLKAIVNLVGPDVLPDAQRLVLLCAAVARDGFLQQNAFDPVDTYCDPARQAGLLRALVGFYRRARKLIQSGAPVMRVREMQIVERLSRARFTIKNEDTDAMAALMRDMGAEFDALEAEYR